MALMRVDLHSLKALPLNINKQGLFVEMFHLVNLKFN
jgi:hypothetical protein